MKLERILSNFKNRALNKVNFQLIKHVFYVPYNYIAIYASIKKTQNIIIKTINPSELVEASIKKKEKVFTNKLER